MHDTHGRLPGRHHRPDHRPARLDDGKHRERLRARSCSSRRRRPATCAPYAFHPMYNSAVPRGSTWGAHTTNVGASDEIGHFEYCNAIDPEHRRMHAGRCRRPDARRRRPGLPRRIAVRGADPDHRLRPGRRRLRRAVVPARLAGLVHEPGARSEAARDAVPFTVAELERQAARERGVRERPARIERGEPGNRQPECDAPDRRALLQPADGSEVLSHLHRSPGRTAGAGSSRAAPHIPGTVNTFGGNAAHRVRKSPVRHTTPTPDSRPSGWPRTSTGISTATPARTDAGRSIPGRPSGRPGITSP